MVCCVVTVVILLCEAVCVMGQDPPVSDNPSTGTALYAVLAVIAVFVVAIITLSIIIVLLYRRKCGHQAVLSAAGEKSPCMPLEPFFWEGCLGMSRHLHGNFETV